MKALLALLLITTSFLTYAQTSAEESLSDEESAYQRMIEKKRQRMENSEDYQERQEQKLNDDLDPEADAIDDDLTEDEGMRDD